MNETNYAPLDLGDLKVSDFEVQCIDTEIAADKLCARLLRRLFEDLVGQEGLEPIEAGEICHGADYFLREFLIADRHMNIFAAAAEQVRQFAGHWYIIRTPEPNMTELSLILSGVHAFYHYLSDLALITAERKADIIDACTNLPYYQQRIEDFWAIEADGYTAWRNACPLPPASDY